jgi:hypothetical protein
VRIPSANGFPSAHLTHFSEVVTPKSGGRPASAAIQSRKPLGEVEIAQLKPHGEHFSQPRSFDVNTGKENQPLKESLPNVRPPVLRGTFQLPVPPKKRHEIPISASPARTSSWSKILDNDTSAHPRVPKYGQYIARSTTDTMLFQHKFGNGNAEYPCDTTSRLSEAKFGLGPVLSTPENLPIEHSSESESSPSFWYDSQISFITFCFPARVLWSSIDNA